jgi:virginiamycin B lyase
MFARMLAGSVVVAALIAATAAAQEKVEFFDVPAGAHPHDVSPAPDGKVWYTAQRQGALGILDPATGAVEQVPLGARRRTA